jgi:hypothetical protein
MSQGWLRIINDILAGRVETQPHIFVAVGQHVFVPATNLREYLSAYTEMPGSAV